VTVLADLTSGEKIAQLPSLKDLLENKKERRSEQHYWLSQVRQQFVFMCKKLNIPLQTQD
jgi:phosphoribosyl-dephospho-CoA transferase